MIDIFALGLTHALLALAAWRLLSRADLDPQPTASKRRRRGSAEAVTPETGSRDD